MRTMLRGVMALGLLTLTMMLPSLVNAQMEKQLEWTPEEKELADKAIRLNAEGEKLYGMGKSKEAAQRFTEALEIRRKLYPLRFASG